MANNTLHLSRHYVLVDIVKYVTLLDTINCRKNISTLRYRVGMKDLEDMINTSHVSTWIFLLKSGFKSLHFLSSLS